MPRRENMDIHDIVAYIIGPCMSIKHGLCRTASVWKSFG
jgi:hypothetical protein